MYKRSYYQTISKRMNEPRKFIQVITGPRQVGKTTLIKQFCQDLEVPYSMFTMDATPATDGNYISDCWDTVRTKMKTQNQSEHILIFDEIQKVSNWSSFVKKEWDADSWNDLNIKVILLGSSRMLIQKGLSESLMGRFEIQYIPHWSYSEMRDAFGFSLNQYLFFGAYPGAASLISDENQWRQYIKDSMIEPTITKDILMLTPINKPVLMRHLFELGCSYSTEILSLTKILGELQDAGNTTTLSNYLHLLDESGLLTGIEKYSGSIVRKRTSIPKFQVYNNALKNAYSEYGFEAVQQHSKEWGRIFESAVGAHLINHTGHDGLQLYYWREGNDEVDFILERNKKLIAIEVKSGNSTKNTGLNVFRQKFDVSSCFYVGTGGLPIEDFLNTNPKDLF